MTPTSTATAIPVAGSACVALAQPKMPIVRTTLSAMTRPAVRIAAVPTRRDDGFAANARRSRGSASGSGPASDREGAGREGATLARLLVASQCGQTHCAR